MATKSIGGFVHLAGRDVRVALDGFMAVYGGGSSDTAHQDQSDQTVSISGTVDVDSLFYGTVSVGLLYTMRAKTLPASFEAAAASRGTAKNVSKIYARMNGSGTAMVGPSGTKLVPMIVEQSAAGEIPEMREIPIMGDWNGDACLVVEHSDPDPFMLQAMVLEIATGG